MSPQISQAATYDNKGWGRIVDHCFTRRGCDRKVVGFITTYRCEFESRSGELYSIQHVKVCQ